VDDEASVLSVMKSALELAKFSVSATTSPSEALEWFRAPAPRIDVLVTDYRMPQLSGLELAQRVRMLRPDVPVILVTGHAEGLPRSGNPAGIHTVMYKPFRISELISAVQKCLAAGAPVASPSATPPASG
jgi:CheY-like chemotaxis protein